MIVAARVEVQSPGDQATRSDQLDLQALETEFIAASSSWLVFCALAGNFPPTFVIAALPALDSRGNCSTGAPDPGHELLRDAQLYLRLLRARLAPSLQTVEGWERFYSFYHPRLTRMAMRCGIRDSEADDLLQEVWIEVSRKLADFAYDPARGRLHGWLSVLVQRKVRAAHRRRRPDKRPANCGLASVPCRRQLVAAELVEKEELRTQVRLAIDQLRKRLSASTWRVLHLKSIEGRSVSEVAEELGLSCEQVWARHHRAKRALRQALEAGQEAGQDISEGILEKT